MQDLPTPPAPKITNLYSISDKSLIFPIKKSGKFWNCHTASGSERKRGGSQTLLYILLL